MRTLMYYVACSADGFISRADGSTDGFLSEGEHLADLFEAFPETLPTHLRKLLGISGEPQVFATVLMGRSTYEVGLNEGITSPYSSLQQVVFSRTMQTSPNEDVTLVKNDAREFVRALKREEGNAIWLCGGGTLASVLLSEIDRLLLKVNPFLIGSGIPLFAEPIEHVALRMRSSKVYPNGFALLEYDLNHEVRS